MTERPVELAREVSTELLRPRAAEVDVSGVFPSGHLDALAATGLYGLAAPASVGGLDADRPTSHRVVEELAAGCLGTTFVWMQHHGVVRAVAAAVEAGMDWQASLLDGLAAGRMRAGIAVGGIRPGNEPLRATPTSAGWRLDGSVPWVTGWGLVDVLHVAARTPAGEVVWLLVEVPREDSALFGCDQSVRVQPLSLTAVRASRTVTLDLRGHLVPEAGLTSRTTYDQWQVADLGALRGNGSLALGLACRCATLHRDGVGGSLPERIDQARNDLDRADLIGDAQRLADARATAAQLAWTAAASLVVDAGSRSTLAGGEPDRAVREAAFLLVFATRPAIREALSGLLSR